jgi:hypothetical protein
MENPAVSLPNLRRQHNITHHDMWKAQEMFQVRRKRGKGSLAYQKQSMAFNFRGRVRVMRQEFE